MSRFVLGNCIDVMARIPDNAIDFILTDPPYLVGFRDRQGRTIAGDKTDEWLQPACNEMYRVLKKDALMVSFYGWNRVDRFTRSLLPVCRDFPVVHPLRFRGLTLQLPPAVCVRLRLPLRPCIPALSPGFYGGTAPPGVAEYVNNGGKHHAICETCHSER